MVTPSPDGPAAESTTGAGRSESQPRDSNSRGDSLYQQRRRAYHEERLATRRRILRWVIRIGTGAFSLALLLPALALRTLTREVQEVTSGDTLVYATGGRSGLPIDVETLAPGTAVQAFPEGKSDNERNLIEVVRLGEDLQSELVAYSAICTHLGCTVLPTLSDRGYIACPCHASVFDPANHARVISGPANRPLPALPVDVSSDGHIVAAGGFEGPVGPA
jgi:rieske iron-sulfur protein